jgi:hypothetical protein
MNCRFRFASGNTEATVLGLLNVAVSVFPVPEVAPGTIKFVGPAPQFDGIAQFPLIAPEYQVLLPASPGRPEATIRMNNGNTILRRPDGSQPHKRDAVL